MLAIDTNVVVRFLMEDDPTQAAKAKALIQSEDVFVVSSVLLETEWVLRSGYRKSKTDVIRALDRFAGLERVTLAEPARVSAALALAAEGMDFADALHVTGAEACEAFVTFDRKLAKADAALPVRLL
jgi:predicted nucleic-acid-binding protein